MKISRITVGRLFNLGDYNHIRYELAIDLESGDLPSVVFVNINRIFADLEPKEDYSEESYSESTKRCGYQQLETQSDDDFNEQHRGSTQTRQQVIDAWRKDADELRAVRLGKLKRQQKAIKALDNLGAVAERTNNLGAGGDGSMLDDDQ